MNSSSNHRRRRRRPQVFISFRGVEVRDNLVKHLVTDLRLRGVNVFIDTFLPEGVSLQQLFTKIEESKIAVVIFSKRFTDSDWCMDELVKMDELEKRGKLVVIPVFYKVSTSDVKNLRGEFGQSYEKLKREYADKEPEKVLKWEASVKSIAGIKGLPSNEDGRVAPPLVHQIANAIQRHLKYMPGGNIKPPEIKWTISEVLIMAFVAAFVWGFFISSMFFNDAKFFKTPQWLFGFPTLVVALWFHSNNNNPPPRTRPTSSTTSPPPRPRARTTPSTT